MPVDDRLRDLIRAECRTRSLEAPENIVALIETGLMAYEAQIYTVIVARSAPEMQDRLDALLVAEPIVEGEEEEELPLSLLRLDPGPVGVESALREIAKLRSLRAIGLPPDLFQGYTPRLVERLRRRIAAESPSHIREHPQAIRMTLLAALVYQRTKARHRCPGDVVDPDRPSHRQASRTPCRSRVSQRSQAGGRENTHPLSHCRRRTRTPR